MFRAIRCRYKATLIPAGQTPVLRILGEAGILIIFRRKDVATRVIGYHGFPAGIIPVNLRDRRVFAGCIVHISRAARLLTVGECDTFRASAEIIVCKLFRPLYNPVFLRLLFLMNLRKSPHKHTSRRNLRNRNGRRGCRRRIRLVPAERLHNHYYSEHQGRDGYQAAYNQ